MRYGLFVYLMLNMLIAQAEVLGDPMRPPGYAQAGTGTKVSVKKGWHLSAIRIDAEHRIAIINGQKVAVGDWVNKARLVEVLPQKVRLKGAQGLFSVRLVKTQVKKNPVSQN